MKAQRIILMSLLMANASYTAGESLGGDKNKLTVVKPLSKVEVPTLENVTAKTHEFKTPERRNLNFLVQKIASPDASTRGWTSVFAPVVVKGKKETKSNPNEPKIVVLPLRPESLALKDRNLAKPSIVEETQVVPKALKVMSDHEEKTLAAKILARKNKCYISIGLWKNLNQEEMMMNCLVHDQYDDVAMMSVKNLPQTSGTEDSDILLSRLNALQMRLVDEAYVKASHSVSAQIISAFERNKYKEVIDRTASLETKKENYKLLVLRVLSLSSLNKNEEALSLAQDIEKLAVDNELTVLHVLKARLYLKLQKPEEAMMALQQMPKEHPLWLESMQDLGWAQLQGQDYSGAIGNMYSLHTPYFRFVYQPQSYVVRTIGYLNLCQYGDAYRSMTEGEQKAQSWSSAMQKPIALSSTVKNYIQTQSSTQNWGLPIEILRELARHRPFINVQKEVNRLVDSQAKFKSIESRLTKLFSESQERAAKNQKELKKIVHDLRKAKQLNRLAEVQRLERQYDFHQESYYARLFEYQLAKNSLEGFRAYLPTVNQNYAQLFANYEQQIDVILQKRFKEITKELAQVVDQNEFLRYEIFAGSGEDIRYQAAGGAIDGTSGRLPATYKPSKSLQWTFDGEIWEDEIGNYRSSLINNCPKLEKAMKANEGAQDDHS